MQPDFCAALVDDDRPALRRVVDDYLKSLVSADSEKHRVEKLREWISGQPCVAATELVPVLLDTEPPIQQIRVVLAGEVERVSRPSEGIMAPQDFCHALQKNDRATLKALLDPELAKLDTKGDEERNFQTLKEWLERHDCVESVEIEAGVLRSNPPIKQFYVTVRTTSPEATAKRDIGIRLSPKRYEFDLR